jgi:hypothetical protein
MIMIAKTIAVWRLCGQEVFITMAKRRIDPEAGKPALAWREEEVLDAISDVRPEGAKYFHRLPTKEAGPNG